ncbi:MAG: DUF2249 domain-containing protein [Pseudomonadota bacterium]
MSELEAPEPLLRAVEELETMPPGDYLRLRHRMKPCHLYDVLVKNSLAWDTRRGEVVECELFIWHLGDGVAEGAARKMAAMLPEWRD